MKDYIKSMYEQGVGISRMITKIEKKFGEKLGKERVKDIIEQLKEEGVRPRSAYTSKDLEREDGGLKNLVQSVSEKPYDYIAETGHIILKMDDMQYPILVSTIDAMIESYSKHGENLSGQQIQYKFSLTPRVWNFIKNAFNIYKDSIPFSIITLLDIPEEQLQSVAKEKADQLLESKMSKIYIDTVNRLKEKKFKDFAKASMGYTVFLEQLDEKLSKIKPININNKIVNINNNDTKDIFITDAHIGKKGTDEIINRFNKLTTDLANCKEKNINITFGGDLGEQFIPIGEKHPGVRLGMEDITVEDLVMLIVDIFTGMLLSLFSVGKKVTFNGMGGNHDHFTDKKDYDPFRTPAMIIYRIMQRLLSNTDVVVNIFREKSNTIKSGCIKYVFLHGDGLSPAELNRRALSEKEDNYYLIICSGDKHHFAIKEISDSVLWVSSPALAGKGKYDSSLALSSLPGALEFVKNNDGLVDIVVKRYK